MSESIGHINGDKADNRLSNLRVATRVQNNRNVDWRPSRSGLPRGVRARGNRFEARIRNGSSQVHLGSFLSADEAQAAYLDAAALIHGEFRREGQS